MSKLTRSYSSKINSILKKILKEEEKKFLQCAKLISKSYKKGGQLYIFGTGHSRLLGEESFHRAGGFAAACPISCLLYTSPSPRDVSRSRMPSSA